jgi:CheY-like chemotaxis protein
MNQRLKLPPAALVVEDDHMMALLCARTLESLGWQVLCCNSSLKAATVAQLHDYRIQFILVDVVLATPEVRLSQTAVHPADDGARLLSLLKHFC